MDTIKNTLTYENREIKWLNPSNAWRFLMLEYLSYVEYYRCYDIVRSRRSGRLYFTKL